MGRHDHCVMRMDKAPGYTSEVMQAYHKILGVKHVDLSIRDNPTPHTVVERRNQVMEKRIDVASSKGDFNTAADVEMTLYCASALSSFQLRPSQRGRKSKQVCIYVVIVDIFRGEHYSPDRASGARPFQLHHQYEYTIGLLEIN